MRRGAQLLPRMWAPCLMPIYCLSRWWWCHSDTMTNPQTTECGYNAILFGCPTELSLWNEDQIKICPKRTSIADADVRSVPSRPIYNKPRLSWLGASDELRTTPLQAIGLDVYVCYIILKSTKNKFTPATGTIHDLPYQFQFERPKK